MKDLKIRCSRIAFLMTESAGNKPLTDKQELYLKELNSKDKLTLKQIDDLRELNEKQERSKEVTLSKGAISEIRRIWRKHQGYEEIVLTDAIKKGLECEQDSMDLVDRVIPTKEAIRLRFNRRLSNDYITGTPDVVLFNDGYVEDIKTSYTLATFQDAELEDLYYGQGQGYMHLINELIDTQNIENRNNIYFVRLNHITKYRLIYCLVKTPEHMVNEERSRFGWKFQNDATNEDFQRYDKQILANQNVVDKFSDIEKVKVFEFDYDKNYIDLLYRKIEKAREYYQTIKLNDSPYTAL